MKNVRLTYTGKIKKVRLAVDKANEILSSEDFYNQIKAYKKFNNSCLSPEIIARLMQESGHEVVVRVTWLTSSASEYNRIRVSGWDFGSNLAGGVNVLIYETVNAIDKLYNVLNTADSESYSDKYTAPWVIGTIAEIMVK
jgi:hypothetical protein